MTRLGFLFAVCALCGCGPANDAGENTNAKPETGVSSSTPRPPAATSPQELANNVKTVLESGTPADFQDLVLWEGDDAHRDAVLNMQFIFKEAGTLKVQKAEVRPAEEGEVREGGTLSPKEVLEVEIVDSDGVVTQGVHPIVQVDGKYLLYFFPRKDL
jgi:hypothetical protein